MSRPLHPLRVGRNFYPTPSLRSATSIPLPSSPAAYSRCRPAPFVSLRSRSARFAPGQFATIPARSCRTPVLRPVSSFRSYPILWHQFQPTHFLPRPLRSSPSGSKPCGSARVAATRFRPIWTRSSPFQALAILPFSSSSSRTEPEPPGSIRAYPVLSDPTPTLSRLFRSGPSGSGPRRLVPIGSNAVPSTSFRSSRSHRSRPVPTRLKPTRVRSLHELPGRIVACPFRSFPTGHSPSTACRSAPKRFLAVPIHHDRDHSVARFRGGRLCSFPAASTASKDAPSLPGPTDPTPVEAVPTRSLPTLSDSLRPILLRSDPSRSPPARSVRFAAISIGSFRIHPVPDCRAWPIGFGSPPRAPNRAEPGPLGSVHSHSCPVNLVPISAVSIGSVPFYSSSTQASHTPSLSRSYRTRPCSRRLSRISSSSRGLRCVSRRSWPFLILPWAARIFRARMRFLP